VSRSVEEVDHVARRGSVRGALLLARTGGRVERVAPSRDA